MEARTSAGSLSHHETCGLRCDSENSLRLAGIIGPKENVRTIFASSACQVAKRRQWFGRREHGHGDYWADSALRLR